MENVNFDRTKGIGGSDIPVLLGLSKWKTPVALYLEKIGKIKEDERLKQDNVNNLLNMGKILESYVIEQFEQNTGEKITRQQERIIHPKYDFLWGTIDGMCNNLVFEVKTTSTLVRAWQEGIPPYVKAQIAYYSYLTNSNGAKIVVLFRDTGEIKTYNYERNIKNEEEIIKYALDFWDGVCKRIPPMPFNYSDVQLLFKEVIEDEKVVASDEDINIISKMMSLKNEIKERENQFESLKANICIKIGNAVAIEDSLGECLVTWKERNINKLSTDILKKTYPHIYNECLLKTTTRMFNLKNRDECNSLMGRY